MYHMKMITTWPHRYPSIGDRMRIVGFNFEFVRGASITPGVVRSMVKSVGQVLEVTEHFQCKTKVRLSDDYIYNLAWLEPYDTASELNMALMLL